MKPSGTTCKCGSSKSEHNYFCTVCTLKLPAGLIADMIRSTSQAGFRELVRRAVTILGLPQTENAKRKKLYRPPAK